MKKIILLLFTSLLTTLLSSAQCYTAIKAGNDYTIAIKTNGTLVGWGKNSDGQLGDGSTVNKNLPVLIGTSSNWAKISVGYNHTLAIKTDGTLWGWGNNAYGKIGVVSSGFVIVPTQIGTANNWDIISAGTNHSTAIKTDGTLWTWGRNFSGQLGDGTNVNKSSPTQIGTATNWKSIAAANEHTLAGRTGNALWAWGDNSQGQLGDGTTIAKNFPIEIGAGQNTWLKIFAGSVSSMAIKTNGTLWTWGNGARGMLGSGAQQNVLIPTQIGTATNWASVSMGFSHTLAIKTDATLWAWGWNASGQLGNGNTADLLVPTYLATTNTSLIAAGVYHSMCTISSGSGLIYTWGNNLFGQIGNGSTSTSDTPVAPTSLACPTTLATNTFNAEIFSIYPNPSNGVFKIATTEKVVKVNVLDFLGREINANLFENEISLTNAQSGNYFVKIKFENGKEAVKKIIIQ